MSKYTVRSIQIVNIVNDLKDGKLILSPYFQRNLVWRETHKKEFIDTILSGYPFPQVFFAKGDIDVDTLRAQQCVVDGQQRLNAILSYVNNELEVKGRHFRDLTAIEKSNFLTYEVPVIDFEARHDDERVREVFKRVNRTFYALSLIEKLASEYGASEMMLLAQYMSGDMRVDFADEELERPDLRLNPNVSDDFIEWAGRKRDEYYISLIGESGAFTSYEMARKVGLMFTLNVISSVLDGYYDRNDKVKPNLERYKDSIENRDEVYSWIDGASGLVLEIQELPPFWLRKANLFTLVVELSRAKREGKALLENWQADIRAFADDAPQPYILAAREGVNNRKERLIRADHVRQLLTGERAIVEARGADPE